MRGYGPPTADGLALLAASIVVPVVLGTLVLRAQPGGRWMRPVAWGVLVAALVGGAYLTRTERAGNRMLLLCAAIFFAMKLVVTTEARVTGRAMPTLARWLAFHFLWPGMRPWAFVAAHDGARPGASRLVIEGAIAMAAGVLLLVTARALGTAGPRYIPSLMIGLAGLGLSIHFGFFRMLAGFWRWRGAAIAPLFDAPQRSRSLSEFWGMRWNRAFSEMAQVAVHRPLLSRAGPAVATMTVFLFSGVLHEMALSVSVNRCYGLPLLYFTLHGGLSLVEKRLGFGVRGTSGSPSRWGIAWTLAWVLVPAPLLFHAPFLDGCIVPLLE